MTRAELLKLIEKRRRGAAAPESDHLTEAARIAFPMPGEPGAGRLWASMIEKPEPGDVVIMRLASGEMLAGTYQEIAPPPPPAPKPQRQETKLPERPKARKRPGPSRSMRREVREQNRQIDRERDKYARMQREEAIRERSARNFHPQFIPAPPPARFELRPLNCPKRKYKFSAPEVASIMPVVEYSENDFQI